MTMLSETEFILSLNGLGSDLLMEGVGEKRPKDGFWRYSEADGSPKDGDNNFYFNVDGDDCSKCSNGCSPQSKKRVYRVSIGKGYESITVSFFRCDSTSGSDQGVFTDVINGVLYAISEYVLKHRPVKISWSAVSKSGLSINPQARASIYEKWSIRYLFPDKYVKAGTYWVRRDVYDSQYVAMMNKPAVPDWVKEDSNPGVKKRAMEEMWQKQLEGMTPEMRKQTLDAIADNERREKEQNEKARRMMDILKSKRESEEYNPNRIKAGDAVYWKQEDSNNTLIGHVKEFTMGDPFSYAPINEDSPLFATVKATSMVGLVTEYMPKPSEVEGLRLYRTVHIKPAKLEKYDEKARKTFIDQVRISESEASSPAKNPNGIKDGDDVIFFDPNTSKRVLRGKVDYMTTVGVFIDWDEQSKSILGDDSTKPRLLHSVYKDTPEESARIQSIIRHKEVERRLAARMARGNPMAGVVPLSDPSLVDHPENPNRIKPGDVVVASTSWNVPRVYWNKKFLVTQMQLTRYGAIDVTLKPMVGRASPITAIRARYLQKDETPEAAEAIARTQRSSEAQAARQQQMGGHSIGDTVSIISGMHRGKTGRIVGFRMQRGVLNAVVALPDGTDARVKIASLQPPAGSPAPTSEGFSFAGFLATEEYFLNRR